MHLALVGRLYPATGRPEYGQISYLCDVPNCSRRNSLRARPRRCAFCTNQCLHFQALHLHGFHFICTLHWCKHCIRIEVAPNLGKFAISALCRIVGDGVVCGPILVGAPFAPTQGLHFEALHLLSFHFICTFYWWKDCTRLQVAPNLGKFHISALF